MAGGWEGEVVAQPGWSAETAQALRAAVRSTGRREVVVPATLAPQRLAVIRACCEPEAVVVLVSQSAGRIDLPDLRAKTSDATAAVYVETPNYFGVIETDVAEIVDTARRLRAVAVVGVDPASLGALPEPAQCGADVVISLREGPVEPAETGEAIMRNSLRAAARIGEIPGVRIRWPGFFRDFVVDFNDTGLSVATINELLRERGMEGGIDLSTDFPALGQAALYNPTETDIEPLAEALKEAINHAGARPSTATQS
jgi:glycine dehydrogenase subunit 1